MSLLPARNEHRLPCVRINIPVEDNNMVSWFLLSLLLNEAHNKYQHNKMDYTKLHPALGDASPSANPSPRMPFP